MTDNCEKFKIIMDNCRMGKYGKKFMSLKEILIKAGEPDLLKQMSENELRYLRDNNYISNMLLSFALEAKNKKNNFIGDK